MIVGLGLNRDEVDLAESTPDWSEAFSRERFVLKEILGNLASSIEHVGSTAVGTLPAKPIIDIAVRVEDEAAIRSLIAKLEAAGYIYRGDAPFQGGHLLVKESSPGVRTHHVHAVTADDPQWQSWLRFRDFLRTDRELRKQYTQLKQELKRRFPTDRRSYTLAKTQFIENVLKRDH